LNGMIRRSLCGTLGFVVLTIATGCGHTGGRARLVNASPDEPSLDATINGQAFASGVAYSTASPYTSVSSGSPQLIIMPGGSTTALLTQNVTLPSSGDTTIIASNFSSNLAAVVLADDNSAPTASDIKLRIVNLAPTLGPADVYIVPPGTDLTTVSPNATRLGFEAATVYFSLMAGSYDVVFTLPGQKFPSIDSGILVFTAGQVRTVAAINSPTAGLATATLSDLN